MRTGNRPVQWPQEALKRDMRLQGQLSTSHARVSKTPMQDRYDKKKVELLRNQQGRKESRAFTIPDNTKLDVEVLKNKLELLAQQKENEERTLRLPNRNRLEQNISEDNIKYGREFKNTSPGKRRQQIMSRESKEIDVITLEDDNTKRQRTDFGRGNFTSNDFINLSSYGAQTTFDLRSKIQQRRKESFQNISTSQSEMEWEELSETKLEGNLASSEVSSTSREGMVVTSTPAEVKTSPDYHTMFLICDTNAIIENVDFVATLITKGSYLGFNIKIIIPFVVIKELDQIKIKDDIGHIARCAHNMIRASQRQKSNHLILQNGHESNKPVDSLQLEVNDDFILNCCLQNRENRKKGELVVLLTKDTNLSIKAASFKIEVYNWSTLRIWLRGYKEAKRLEVHSRGNIRNNLDEVSPFNNHESVFESMEVDVCPSLSEIKVPSGMESSSAVERPLAESQRSPSGHEPIPKSIKLVTCITFYLDAIKEELQQYLHNVLENALEKEYRELKKYANSIRPGWTLYKYISEIQRRWFLINNSQLPNETQEVLRSLINAIKKSNQKENLVQSDVKNMYSLCIVLAKILLSRHSTLTENFLQRLNDLNEEWAQKYANISSSEVQPTLSWDETLQPVDLALQNILNYLKTDFEILKKRTTESAGDENDEETLNSLANFYSTVSNLLVGLRTVFKKKPEILSTIDDTVIHLHKIVSKFYIGEENCYEFEISRENVVALFQDTTYRMQAKKMIDKFDELETEVDALIKLIESNQAENIPAWVRNL